MAQTVLSLKNVEKVYRTGVKEFKALVSLTVNLFLARKVKKLIW